MALQYGQYDLEKTTTPLSLMIPCALDFASAMAAGEIEGPKNRRRRVPTKAMVGDLLWIW